MNESVTGRGSPENATHSTDVGLVPFLYGVTGREELPGVALVRLLGDLGLSTSAARSLIARLRRDGLLSATPRGRGADYRLAGNLLTGFQRVSDRRRAPVPEWEGFFHAVFYSVPEASRAYRDRLRRAAALAGYGQMQPGVLISLTDRRARLLEELGGPPPSATIYYGSVGLPQQDAADIAYRAWGLAELNARFGDHIERLDAALTSQETPREPDAGTLAAFIRTFGDAPVDSLHAPPLPPQLLPPDWKLPDLHAALGRASAHFGPPARAYAQRVIAEAQPPAAV